MSLVLEGVSKVVKGQHHIYPTDLTLEHGTMNVLLGPTLSGKTTLMWQNIGDASSRLRTAQEVMDSLCDQQDAVLARIERSGVQGDVGPKLNPIMDDEYWLSQPGAPWPKLDDEKGEPINIAYEELIRRWTE